MNKDVGVAIREINGLHYVIFHPAIIINNALLCPIHFLFKSKLLFFLRNVFIR